MTVYIDDYYAEYGRMRMCHMIADSTDELLAMADKLGLKREWLQHSGTHHEHFDISITKKVQAIKYGAVSVTVRELGLKLVARRKEGIRREQ